MLSYEKYEHHGTLVSVRSDLKGAHRAHCLCFSCQLFAPGTLNNCHIAQATFENCMKFNTVTPVWECPSFLYGEPQNEVSEETKT